MRPAVKVNPVSRVFAKNLRNTLVSMEVSQNKLSRDAGVCLAHLNRVLSGKNNVGLEYAVRIASTLEVDIRELLKGSEEALELSEGYYE